MGACCTCLVSSATCRVACGLRYILPDGTVFAQPWCRPQNDGPALRAKTLMQYASNLSDTAYIRQHLWTADGKGAIPTDLDFVVASWNTET